MKIKGIIFDFNGTLFYDTPLHIEAWRVYSKKLRGYPFTDREMEERMIGHTNGNIIEYCIGKKPDRKMVLELSAEKEKVYRDMCSNDPENTKLVCGATEFLGFLCKNNIPLTIATGSDKVNVDFFIETFRLEKWFDLPKIVFEDGSFPGKPEPDIYHEAARRLGLDISECIVVEDALAGIEAARRAGAGMIIAIAPKDKQEIYKNIDCVDCLVCDFNEVDRSIFADCIVTK